MIAANLIRYYERIAGAPNAIGRLRQFVLDLALRGRLVEPDPRDEPASTLLERIATEGLRASSSKVASEVTVQPLPPGWCWTTLGALVIHSESGWSPKTLDHPRVGDAWGVLKVSAVSWNEFQVEQNKQVLPGTEPRLQAQVRRGDFLISRANTAELVARAVIVESDPVHLMMSDKIVRLILTQLCCPRYLWLVNNFAGFAREHYVRRASGVSPSMKNVTREAILQLPIPLPPLAEQHRIVAKVDELMALCDRLGAAQAERDAARDRLAAATIAPLNTPDLETFAEDGRFALDALPALTARDDQIKQLRRTILNLAARGWLSSQDARGQEPVALGAVAKLQNGYAFKSEWFAKSGVRLLRNTNVAHGVLDWHNTVHLPEERTAEFERFKLCEGDVVLSLDRPFIATGTKVATISNGDLPALLLQRVGRFVIEGDLDPDYLLIWINSPHFSEQIDPGRSNGVPHVSSKQVESAKIFLPKLREQRRVVVKVRELMALCDQLEASLKATAEHLSRLLEALLQDALESGIHGDAPARADEAAVA